MLKLEDNPPILFPEVSDIKEINGIWRVARTKPRQEKILAQNLVRREIPYFLPLIEKVHIRTKRRFKSLLPLFSGYLFFNGDDEKRLSALQTNRIVQILEVIEQETFTNDLSQIYQALVAGVPIDPHPKLQPGDRCRVKAGPLIGIEGILLRKKNITRILLKVDILGQGASVEVDADLLEILDD